MCHTCDKAFKRRLVHSIALVIIAKNNFLLLLKSFIADVLKCKARLQTKFECVCVTMCSLSIKPIKSLKEVATYVCMAGYQIRKSLFPCTILRFLWLLRAMAVD